MDILFLSSVTEGLPNVLIEAQALGVAALEAAVNGDGRVVLAIQRDAERDEASIDDVHSIAVIAHVGAFRRLPGGGAHALVEGKERVRIDAFDRRIVEAVASRRRTDLNALLIPVNYLGRAGLRGQLAVAVGDRVGGVRPPAKDDAPPAELDVRVVVLGLGQGAYIARMARSSLLEVIREDYVRTARAKGLNARRVISLHALPNALLPVITLSGILLGFVLAGSIPVERAFGAPGLGYAMFTAVSERDVFVMQNLVFLYAVVFVMLNIAVDVTIAWLDPRIRYQ